MGIKVQLKFKFSSLSVEGNSNDAKAIVHKKQKKLLTCAHQTV